MDVEIIPFDMKYYEAVYRLWQSCEGIGLSEADAPERIQSYLDRNPGCSFIARQGDCILGAVLGGHDGRRGYLHHLAVLPEARKKGIGSRLVDAALQAIRQQGIDRVHIFVYADNKSGIAFWQRIGWRLRDHLVIMSVDIESRVNH